MVKRRGEKKVQVWQSGDTSNEEAPSCDPKRKDLMQKEQSKVISMLVAMEMEDGLRRGAIMVITEKIGLAHADLLYHKTKKLFYCYVLLRFSYTKS